VSGDLDRAHVRLAELVGALSLGVDLGFGQPMEHVLRQCLIVYYTALLVNAGLTAREVEVLRLLAQGLSNKEIARRLVISPKTAGNHIEHIYAKIDASSRATASLFAMQHGLLPEEELIPEATAVA
jgi:DNA-binding CsgD family transcriptional regulator